MTAWWDYFWPAFLAGLVIGVIAGRFAYRATILPPKERGLREKQVIMPARATRTRALAGGVFLTIAAAALWHGPLGAADRFSSQVERIARQVLVDFEAPRGVTVRMHHGPLTRQLILSGPSDDFQRGETARLLSGIPGVSSASWTSSPGIPLIVEVAGVAVLGFLFGLLLAYLVELRRRHNAQWNW
jgi:hypothetical protein